MSLDIIISSFVVLWSVIDPIGTVPVFIAATKNHTEQEKAHIAKVSSLVAFFILLFFMIVGEVLLRRVGVPLSAFQTSGGIILFIFAMNMIFGSSKPEEELQLIKNNNEVAIFPLAIPSIASPGAILAIVLLSESGKSTFLSQSVLGILLVVILIANYILMITSNRIHAKIGNSGAIVLSKVMGLILASMAANNVLLGVKTFFNLS